MGNISSHLYMTLPTLCWKIVKFRFGSSRWQKQQNWKDALSVDVSKFIQGMIQKPICGIFIAIVDLERNNTRRGEWQEEIGIRWLNNIGRRRENEHDGE